MKLLSDGRYVVTKENRSQVYIEVSLEELEALVKDIKKFKKKYKKASKVGRYICLRSLSPDVTLSIIRKVSK
jgi:hypothetical protein